MSLMSVLKSAWLRAQFYPGFLGLFVNPFYFARKGLLANIKAFAWHIKGRTLDVGCGQKPYRGLFSTQEYVGLEIDSPHGRNNKHADFFYDGKNFPFPETSFDSVITNQVIEHVFNPDEFLAEIYRVLKPGGTLLLTVPFAWDEHEQPWDFARYSSFGIRHLVEKSGFEVIESCKTMPDVRVLFQLGNAYLYKICPFKGNRGRLFFTLCMAAPLNILGEIAAVLLPGNPDLYLDNVLVARKAS